MTDPDKINAKLDAFDASNGLTIRDYHDQNTMLIDALRIAVEGCDAIESNPRLYGQDAATRAAWSKRKIAEALEGKP
jgi:hypothetical protein